MAEVRKVAADIDRFAKGLNQIARGLLKEEGEKLVRYIKFSKFRAGGKPGPRSIVNRTGQLQSTLKSIVKFSGRGLTMEISMSGPQARILEEGGTTRPHEIRPKRRGGVLYFFWPKVGAFVAFKKVNHPGSRFIARRIIERSFEERSTQIAKNVENGMLKEWEQRVG